MINRTIPSDEHLPRINEAIDQLDTIKLNALERLRTYQEAKLSQLEVEFERLQKKHGEDHELLKKIRVEGRLLENAHKATDLQITFFRMQADTLEKESWRIQGFVYDKTGTPVTKAPIDVVAVVSEKTEHTKSEKTNEKSVGSGVTNEHGFYMITIDKAHLGKLDKQKLFLQVLDEKKKQVLFTSANPLTPMPGTIEEMNVSLHHDSQTKKLL